MGFLAPAFLLGLFALAIPFVVHLLNRRRYETIDWAAMQFLQVSERTRKKILLEQFWLMLLRMAAIALLVLGVASPWVKSPWLAKISPRPNRAVVVIVDGSFSMGYQQNGTTAHEVAQSWASDLVSKLQPGDAIGIVHAKQQPKWLWDGLSTDLARANGSIRDLPKSSGGINLAGSLREAISVLATSSLPQKDIIILSDGQQHGFADPKSLERLELLASGIPERDWPNIWSVNVVPDRPENAPNWSLAPIQSTRGIAPVGREVKFKTELQQTGLETEKSTPKVRFEVDGRPVADQTPQMLASQGRIPLTFSTRFTTTGSHLVSVLIDDDAMPGDNRQDFAIEIVPTIPVLIVDGDSRMGNSHGVEFLRDALAPANDKSPSFLVKQIAPSEFNAEALKRPLGREPSTIPRVVVLYHLSAMRADQSKAIEEFLNSGGGVFVTVGARTEGVAFNQELYREGKGWLPAKLIEPVGDVNDLVKAPRLSAVSFESPFLEIFKSEDPGTLAGSAYFPRYWKVDVSGESGGLPIAMFANRQPLLVEKSFNRGHVILSTLPMDNAWRTNLTDLGDYVRLMHEVVYYLASAREADSNLEARQPIIFRPRDGERPGPVTVSLPVGTSQRISVTEWPMMFDDTRETGVYQVTTDTGKKQYFVVQPDSGESVLKKLTDDDHVSLKRLLPTWEHPKSISEILTFTSETEPMVDFWWLLWLLVIVVLAGEVWMTRRIVSG